MPGNNGGSRNGNRGRSWNENKGRSRNKDRKRNRNEDRERNRSGRIVRVLKIDRGEDRSTGVTTAVVTRAGEAAVSTEDMDEGMGVTSPGADTVSTNATNTSIRPRRLDNSHNCPLTPLMDTRRTRVYISYLLPLPLPTSAPTTLAGTRCTNIHPSHLPLRCTHLSLNLLRNFHSHSIPPGTIYLGSSNIT